MSVHKVGTHYSDCYQCGAEVEVPCEVRPDLIEALKGLLKKGLTRSQKNEAQRKAVAALFMADEP